MFYCSKRCQVENWPTHKLLCKQAKKDAKLHLEEVWDAATEGESDELRRLLKTYPTAINMFYTQDHGWLTTANTVLISASARGLVDIVKILLDNGADQHLAEPMHGQLPIHRAAEGGHLEVIKLLLKRGADTVLQPDGMGQTPLHFAAEEGRIETVKYLLENGARPCLSVLYRGKTPKMWAMMGGHNECAELL